MMWNNIFGSHIFRIVAGIMLMALLLAGVSSAAIISVDDSGGAMYMKIQDAINNASAGDTVEVQSGTYYENVNVNKKLTLRGIGMPVVDAMKSGSSITLAANETRLEGFTAILADGFMEAGIMVTSNGNTLSGNNASNNYNGILLRNPGGNNNTLIGNTALNNHYGIFLYYSSNNNTLLRNNVSNINHGIYDGIYLSSSSYNTLIGNKASNNLCGIVLEISSNNNTLSGNNASNNYDGICLRYDSNNNTLLENSVSDNEIGIYLRTSSNNTIYNNIFNNTNNIHFDYPFIGYIVSNFNTWNAIKQSGTNILGGSHLGGNSWANPDGTGFSDTCVDADLDGICNSPFTLDSNNTDYLPLARTPVTSLPTPTPTPTSGTKGDVSGDGQVSVVDALFIAQYTVGSRTLSSEQLAAADVNGDGQVTIVDALFIAQYTVGLRQL